MEVYGVFLLAFALIYAVVGVFLAGQEFAKLEKELQELRQQVANNAQVVAQVANCVTNNAELIRDSLRHTFDKENQ